jgi:potassium-transporting ATPase KdpC subunit
MKHYIIPSVKLTLICLVFFSGIYTLLIFGIAQFSPEKGEGVSVVRNGKIVGYTLEGQNFTNDNYFNSRPSAVGYNAAGSGGSNKGPSNPDYLKDVQSRIDSFMRHNPAVTKDKIPCDLVTASGSGLDPDISPESAYVQVDRIARFRGLSPETIRTLIAKQIKHPLMGLFGPAKVNVLNLNLALDDLKQ